MWSSIADALGRTIGQLTNSCNSARLDSYGLHASTTRKGKFRLDMADEKWPKLNPYIAQMKFEALYARAGASEL